MKKYIKVFPTILFISLVLPSVAFASWWNPFSWFKQKQPTIVQVATSTILNTTSASGTIQTQSNISTSTSLVIKSKPTLIINNKAQVLVSPTSTTDSNNQKIQQLEELNNELGSINAKYKSQADDINQQIINLQNQYSEDMQTASMASDTAAYNALYASQDESANLSLYEQQQMKSQVIADQITQQANTELTQLKNQYTVVMTEWKQEYDQNRAKFNQLNSQ